MKQEVVDRSFFEKRHKSQGRATPIELCDPRSSRTVLEPPVMPLIDPDTQAVVHPVPQLNMETLKVQNPVSSLVAIMEAAQESKENAYHSAKQKEYKKIIHKHVPTTRDLMPTEDSGPISAKMSAIGLSRS